MEKVKFKSIALLTGSIFTLLFFHFAPVDTVNVTTVGTNSQEAATEIIEENTAIAKATRQGSFEPQVKDASQRKVFGGSFGTRRYVVPAQTSSLKN